MKNRWLVMACALPFLVACDHQSSTASASNTIETQPQTVISTPSNKRPANTTKCDWNDQDSYGQTLLHKIYNGTAWTEKSFDEKRALLSEGFKNGRIDPNLQDDMGYTAAHYAIRLMYEVIPYDPNLDNRPFIHPIEFLDILISQPSFNPNIRDYYYRRSPLMQLFSYNDIFDIDILNKTNNLTRTKEIASTLLKRDDIIFNWQDGEHVTILQSINEAIDSVHINPCNCSNEPHQRLNTMKEIKEMIEAKNRNLIYPYNNNENWELHGIFLEIGFNSDLSYFELFNNYLLESFVLGADPNFLSDDQYTLLTILADINNRYHGADIESNNALRTKLAMTVIQHGADVNISTEGRAPLHFALGSNNVGLVKLLLTRKELNLNLQDREGNTAIMNFFKYHDDDTFEEQSRLLFERRNDINWYQKNYNGENLHDVLNKVVTKYNRESMNIWLEESLRVSARN